MVSETLLRKSFVCKEKVIYPYGFNERAKNSNLENPTGKLFLPLPVFGNRRENLEKRHVNESTKFDTTDTLFAYIETFPPKTRSDNFRRTVERMKRKDLRKGASNTIDELKKHVMILRKGGES